MTTSIVVAESHQTLATHARSFRWAAVFLPPAQRDDAVVLYAFCRAVDDAVDEAVDQKTATRALERHREALGTPKTLPLADALRAMSKRRGMPLWAAHQLIDGMSDDLGEVLIADDRELIRYCYRAAGTVGLLMCGVLGVNDGSPGNRLAMPHAVDLGVAMQLTNICRDVAEDAARGRVYLPRTRLEAAGTSPDALLRGDAAADAVAQVVRDLLLVAENYYASADRGMCFIPARPRLAILVASRIYRAIGRRLRRTRNANPLGGRVIVPAWEKVCWLLTALVGWACIPFRRNEPHRAELHLHLDGLLR